MSDDDIELATVINLHTKKRKLKNLRHLYDDLSKKPEFTINDFLREIRFNNKLNDQIKKQRFIDDLKLLPLSIEEKELILAKAYPKKHQLYLSSKESCMNLSYLLKSTFTSMTRALNRFFKILFSPLENQTMKIERNYGTETSSYFEFLKSLLVSNIFASVIILIPFILVPHVMVLDREIKENKSFEYCTGLKESFTKLNALDLVLPDNVILLSFYGCFSNEVQTFLQSDPKSYYNMHYAYILTIIFYFLYWLFNISTRFATTIRKRMINTRLIRDRKFFSETLFTSLHYGLQKKDAIEKKKREIYVRLADNLSLIKVKKSKELTCAYVSRIAIANIIFCAFAASVLCGIYYFITNYIALMKSARLEELYEALLAVSICLLNFIVPIVCNLLAKIENLKNNSIASALKIARILVIQITAIFFVFYSSMRSFKANPDKKCFETSVARLVYTFIIVDTLFYLVFDVCFVVLKYLIKKMFKLSFAMEFDVSYYTFSVINSQSLIWIGTYFAPFLNIYHMLKFLLIFSIDSLLVQKFYNPSQKMWSMSRINSFYSLMTMVTFFLTFIGMGYFAIEVETSKDCGPFREANYSTPIDYLFKIKNNIEESNELLKTIILIFTSPGLIAFLMFILVAGVYTSYSIMSSHKEAAELLHKTQSANKKTRKAYNEQIKIFKSEINFKYEEGKRECTKSMNKNLHEYDEVLSLDDDKSAALSINSLREYGQVSHRIVKSALCIDEISI